MACENSKQVGNFLVSFDGATPVASTDLVRWCWTITFNTQSGPALSHWGIQTCSLLSLDQLERFQIIDVTDPMNPVTLLNTNDPAVIASLIDFAQGFPDGFPVYGMKTDLPSPPEFPDFPELGSGDSWQFCYDFNEGEVPLTEAPGWVATKSGPGQAADAIVFGLCSPGCEVPPAPGRGFRI